MVCVALRNIIESFWEGTLDQLGSPDTADLGFLVSFHTLLPYWQWGALMSSQHPAEGDKSDPELPLSEQREHERQMW